MADDLKLTRVALFNSGVGYFEADGAVEGDATTELRFRTAQINDLIKSLVLQDFDGGTIRAVQYPSRDPIEKTLKSFGVDITGRPTLGQLLDQLRGVPVEVQTRTGQNAIRGVIVGVERQKVILDKETLEVDVLNVLTDAGLSSVRLPDVTQCKITDSKVEGELKKALATLATSHDADKKTVTLSFAGKGKRRVRVGYMLEAPIWKTSYRLVLADQKKPYLQGWATVENTTEEDWSDVRLSLVSGRPISFIMDLYSPIYISRPVEELELYASLRPPTYEGAMDEAERPLGGMPSLRAPMSAALKAKEGRAEESDDKATAKRYYAGRLYVGAAAEAVRNSVASVASAERAGELFAYEIQTPVSLKRQQSAMLPIVTSEIEGAKVSIYNPATHPKYPLNGIQFTNSSGLNLMQGPVTVFDGNTYAGDAKLPDVRPGEKRMISYALDLALEVEQVAKSEPEPIVSVKIVKGVLESRRKSTDTRVYNVNNKDSKVRTLLIEQPFSADWTLTEPKEPSERTRDVYRFKVDVAANSKASQTVTQERNWDQAIALLSCGLDQVQFYVNTRVISPRVKEALQQVMARRMAISDIGRQRAELEQQVATIEKEQDRIRENMKALPPNSDVGRRYLAKLDQQETQIEQLRTQVETTRKQEAEKQADLERFIAALDIE